MSHVKIVFGAAEGLWNNSDDAQGGELLDLLEELGIKNIDTARIYGTSEELIGKRMVGSRFTVDTKHPGGLGTEGSTHDSVLSVAKTSFDLLQLDHVDVYYLHWPDSKTPIAETLEAINQLYKQGRFRRFGLSNFSAVQVDEVVRVAKEKGFVIPSVYQGSYSAVFRKQDILLFPTLRKHNIAFYAYSPMAGGFLTKSRSRIVEGEGRFVTGGTWVNDYSRNLLVREHYLDFVDKWERISNESGIPKDELAIRWIVYHSQLSEKYGDAVIIGASKTDQLRNTVGGVNKGPLPEVVAQQIEEAWESIKDAAVSEE